MTNEELYKCHMDNGGRSEIDTIEMIIELNRRLSDVTERIENMEKHIQKEKEEQLKKLKAELDYAKFCGDLEKENARIRNDLYRQKGI